MRGFVQLSLFILAVEFVSPLLGQSVRSCVLDTDGWPMVTGGDWRGLARLSSGTTDQGSSDRRFPAALSDFLNPAGPLKNPARCQYRGHVELANLPSSAEK